MSGTMKGRERALVVVIAGGGTGGHLYPGIAVASELQRRRPGTQVTFVGTARGLEARVVPREGYQLDVIRSAGLKGKALTTRLRGAALVPLSVVDAWRVLSRRRPDVVIGVGGYSSGPVVLVAALRGVPTMVLEQNAVPGLTNRLLAPWVKAAAVTYEETTKYFRGRAVVTGNPVRAQFLAPDRASSGSTSGSIGKPVSTVGGSAAPRVLVLGGSLGAHALNVALVDAASDLHARYPGLVLVHQTGTRDLDTVRAGYAQTGLDARAAVFIDDVATEMAAADIVIARAGATTLAELAACGCPAILVPFPAATDDHQRRNADVLAGAGAALMLEERDLSRATLLTAIDRLLASKAARAAMSDAMRQFARPDAASRIADRIFALADGNGAAA